MNIGPYIVNSTRDACKWNRDAGEKPKHRLRVYSQQRVLLAEVFPAELDTRLGTSNPLLFVRRNPQSRSTKELIRQLVQNGVDEQGVRLILTIPEDIENK